MDVYEEEQVIKNIETQTKTIKIHYLRVRDDFLKVVWDKITKSIGYDFPKEWWLGKSPSDELEEFLIEIAKIISLGEE